MKTTIKNELAKLGVEVLNIRFFDYSTPTYKVSISWTDLLKARELNIEGVSIEFIQK